MPAQYETQSARPLRSGRWLRQRVVAGLVDLAMVKIPRNQSKGNASVDSCIANSADHFARPVAPECSIIVVDEQVAARADRFLIDHVDVAIAGRTAFQRHSALLGA